MSAPIPRRKWIKSVSTGISVAAAAGAQQPVAKAQSAAPAPAAERPNLEITGLDAIGETFSRFFTNEQFAALRRLADLLLPPNGPMPGAVTAEAPEFLDFFLSQSTAERQTRFRAGLDRLNAEARKRSLSGFAAIDETAAKPLLAPLLEPWTYKPPKDEFARFLREAKDDLFRAMVNSKQYADAQGGRRRSSGMNTYWHAFD